MRRRWIVVSLVCLIGVASCTTWRQVAVPAPPAPMQTLRGASRVTLRDRSSLELVNVVIATDSLFGIGNDLARLHFSVPLQNVVRIEHQEKEPIRTMILIGAILVVLGFGDVLGAGFK